MHNMKSNLFHKSAFVESSYIGKNTRIWHNAHIRKSAKIGSDCVIGKNVYIDRNVTIGNKVKIQNNASIYEGVAIGDGVFVGPHVCFTNDKSPRAINPEGKLICGSDWKIQKTIVKEGVSIGANSTIVCGITIGKFAMMGAGSVVTKNVSDYALVYGNPAKFRGYVCKCGSKAVKSEGRLKCSKCRLIIKI